MIDLTNCLNNLNKDNVLWIGGDFNLPDIDWKTQRITGHQYPMTINNMFLDKIQDLALTQTNEIPTRGNNILDLFFTNRPSLIKNSTTIPGLSDHDIVLIDSFIRANITKPIPRTISVWKKADINAMRNDTKTFTNKILENTTDVEEIWDATNNHLQSILKTHVPTKTCSTKYHQPWITTDLKRLSRRKKKAWARAKRTNEATDRETYKTLKKETRRANRTAFHNYVNNLITEDSNKNLWKFVKSRKRDTMGVVPLNKDNSTYTTSIDKANILNDQFCSVFTQEDTSNLPPIDTNQIPPMPNITVTVPGVQKLLEELQPRKAAGPDGIPCRLLQLCAEEIAPALTKLFQLSLDTGNIPSIWKHAIVQPIFKKGDRNNASNYRPISLTCICCKILEHIVRSAITQHLETHGIITDSQHGFRKHRSCETQLISIIHDLTTELDRGGQTDAILLDFAKAFDKVPHQRLLSKLKSVGVTDNTLQWVASFLSYRTQEVVVGGEKSAIGNVTSGVPQGSVLGPTLFLIYINDLGDNIKANVRLFADDTILYQHISSPNDCRCLNEDLSRLQQWEMKWQMEFNVSKCHVITFTNKKKTIEAKYSLHGQFLEQVDSAKYLGIELSKDLKWKNHITSVTHKANKISAFIWRNLKQCPIPTQTKCYKALVRPVLEYASVVWDPNQTYLVNQIEAVQKRTARRICNDFSPYTSASSLVQKLGLEPLGTRRKKNKMTTMFKIMNNTIDVSLPNSITRATRNTRGHSRKLIVPKSRIDAHINSFFPSTVRLWNGLPADMVDASTLSEFVRLISFYVDH